MTRVYCYQQSFTLRRQQRLNLRVGNIFSGIFRELPIRCRIIFFFLNVYSLKRNPAPPQFLENFISLVKIGVCGFNMFPCQVVSFEDSVFDIVFIYLHECAKCS